jgi:arsenate reductase
MKVYGLRNCDTCRKAMRELAEAGHNPELVDVRDTPLDAATLDRFEGAFGAKLVNSRSTTWRGLSEAARALPVPELLAAHPAVMKRPVIETLDGGLHLGWDASVKSSFL